MAGVTTSTRDLSDSKPANLHLSHIVREIELGTLVQDCLASKLQRYYFSLPRCPPSQHTAGNTPNTSVGYHLSELKKDFL